MQRTGKACLLIVDDSRETVVGLRCYYSPRFDVLTAYDGGEAVRLLDSAGPSVDLVICDLLMPGTSGAGLIGIIKTRFPDLPVIAITGWSMHQDRLAAITRADCILFKPFEMEALDQQVERLLERRWHPIQK